MGAGLLANVTQVANIGERFLLADGLLLASDRNMHIHHRTHRRTGLLQATNTATISYVMSGACRRAADPRRTPSAFRILPIAHISKNALKHADKNYTIHTY